MNQVELEQEMCDGGRARAIGMIRNNEEGGRAYNNPYAQAIYRRFVQPLADAISIYVAEKRRGVQATAKALLREHDPLVLSFITIRTILGMHCKAENKLGGAANTLGRSVYGEALLARFEQMNPALYYTLVRDFERRMTKDERHRVTVFKREAKQAGIAMPLWSATEVAGVGMLLLSMARDLGLVEFSTVYVKKRPLHLITMSEEVRGIVEHITSFVMGMMPVTLPCVEPPREWVSANDGGYHTPAMRRSAPCIIRGRPAVEHPDDVPPMVLRAASALQNVAWQVNAAVFNAVEEVSKHFDVGEVLSQAELPKPPVPEWLSDDMNKDTMTPQQLQEFAQWKAEVREWHTQRRIRGVQWGRYYETIRVARQFINEPRIHFVYQCDYRGRFYAITRGLNPQGSDLQKALLRAAVGKPIDTEAARRWFLIAGANRFGFDKAPLDARVAWVEDRRELLCAVADDPSSNRAWCEADAPFQFLAWCFEYASFVRSPETFVSHLPLGQDGSCNGLQHFSAILRDRVGGSATNLIPAAAQQDIYRLVAERTAALVAEEPDDAESGALAYRWKRHTLTRGLVKRSVMTLPYGSTRYSCADFITSEYLQAGMAPEFAKTEYAAAANWLSHRVWAAIGDVVIAAREAMAWLQRQSDDLMRKEATAELHWRSPSGFMVRQRYHKVDSIQIETRLVGGVRIRTRLGQQTEEADPRRHHNGIAPNFIHACDAAHLHLLVNAAQAAGIEFLAMIHDDYGTLAADTETLQRLIRETFVQMYSDCNPLELFREGTGVTSELPASGDLDIKDVLQSTYFFC